MGLPLWLQYLVIGVVVLAALWIFVKKQMPGTLRRLRLSLATPLVRDGRPDWMRGLARRIAAPSQWGGAVSCGGCNDCGPEGPKRSQVAVFATGSQRPVRSGSNERVGEPFSCSRRNVPPQPNGCFRRDPASWASDRRR